MPYNAGFVGTAYSAGYVGTYTGGGVTLDLELTSHGEAHPNSIMAEANFATTGTVLLGVVTDTDQNKVQIDWQAISDGQLWREDIDTLDAVTVTATEDTTATFTLAWRVVDTGEEGQFTGTLNIAEPAADTSPAQFTFTDQTDVEPGSVGESNAITISDVDAGEDIPVTVTGGEYAVDAGAGFGAFTSTGTNVQLGYQIKVRNTASSEFETATNTTLDAGGTTDTFTRTTRAAVLPTLDTPLPDISADQGDAINVDVSDNFTGADSYSVSGIPAGSGLSFSGSVLSGTLNAEDVAASPYTLTVTASNDDGDTEDAFSMTVAEVVAPPLISRQRFKMSIETTTIRMSL